MDHDLSPINDKDAEPNRQFPFSIDLKQNIARLTQVKNKGKEAWHQIFTRYISKQSKGRESLAVNYVLD